MRLNQQTKATKKVFLIGTCVTQDIVVHCMDLFNDNSYGVETYTKYISAKFSTTVTNTGPMAERIQTEMGKTIETLPDNVVRQYYAIARPYSLDDLLKLATPNDILILDLHGELYPSYDDGKDQFVLGPLTSKQWSYFPKWLLDKIKSFTSYQADMLSNAQIKRRKKNLFRVAEKLHSVFHSNVIVIGSVYTDRVYVPTVGTAGKLIKIPGLKTAIPFLTVTESGDENHINFEYFSLLYDSILVGMQKKIPDWTYIHPDRSLCFSDLDHKWGVHPIHLHSSSLEQFREPLKKALAELTAQTKIISNLQLP